MKRPKAKGSEGEREFAALMTARGFPAHRGVQWVDLFNQEPDVILDTLPGIHVEVKRLERLNIHKALAQAGRDAGRKVPVLAFRRNSGPWFIALRLEDWIATLPKGDPAVMPPRPETANGTGPRFNESSQGKGEAHAIP